MNSAHSHDPITDIQGTKSPPSKEGLTELIQSFIAVHEENQKLTRELDVYKKAQEYRENLSFDGEVYYYETKGKKDGPFCTGCLDIDQKLVRVHPREDDKQTPIWLCKVCDFEYRRS